MPNEVVIVNLPSASDAQVEVKRPTAALKAAEARN